MIQTPTLMGQDTTTAPMAQATTNNNNNNATIYIDTQHEALVHDSQMDFYGSKLATCSSGMYTRILLLLMYHHTLLFIHLLHS